MSLPSTPPSWAPYLNAVLPGVLNAALPGALRELQEQQQRQRDQLRHQEQQRGQQRLKLLEQQWQQNRLPSGMQQGAHDVIINMGNDQLRRMGEGVQQRRGSRSGGGGHRSHAAAGS